jgi:mannose-1-phosphate guanylyltransferase/mannose-1-phosphate guanylyltransferase/mannose-6-phosphate isomerase
MKRIIPVLLSGGSGTRLWPLSRESYPKQFLPIVSDATMLQETAARVADERRFAPALVICNAEHRFIVAEQLRQVGLPLGRIVLEPVGRNTAPAIAVAALLAERDEPEAVLLVMPADHSIGAPQEFLAAVEAGLQAARNGALVLFGIQPNAPVTGYGYIEVGEALSGAPDIRRVARFAEKPNRTTAEAYLAGGRHLWNSGIFLLPVRLLIAELRRLEPDLLAACVQAINDGAADSDFLRLDPEAFGLARSVAIDVAVMERTDAAVVVPVDCAWADVGSWSSIWDVSAKDAAGNVLVGDVVVEGAANSYLRSSGPLLAAIGVDDLVVVAAPDAVLVTSKLRDNDVKIVTERLKREGRSVATRTPRRHRRWGFVEEVFSGDRFLVERLALAAHASAPLGGVADPDRRWISIGGPALLVGPENERRLSAQESMYVPLSEVVRVENLGDGVLHLIAVSIRTGFPEEDDWPQ